MRARGPRFGWYVIDGMKVSGSHTDESGQQYADFTVSYRLRRWHPGYWWALLRALWASR